MARHPFNPSALFLIEIVNFLAREFVIGIDLGTTGMKLMIIDDAGVSLGSVFKPYPLTQPKMAWAEQNPRDWTLATTGGIREILAKTKIASQRVVGIGIASQIDGVVVVDDSGEPVGNAIIWMDRRAKRQCDAMRLRIDENARSFDLYRVRNKS